MAKILTIINYGSGNLKSVYNAIEKTELCDEILISSDFEDLKRSTHAILPGVGAYNDCMTGLRNAKNLIDQIYEFSLKDQKPLLGICAGMQVLSDQGTENGECEGLRLIAGRVEAINKDENFDHNLKIPQIGWNNLRVVNKNPIVKNIEDGQDVYFANSFRFVVKNQEDLVAKARYSCDITAIVAKDNIFGIQFHPEKSGQIGIDILKNFINL